MREEEGEEEGEMEAGLFVQKQPHFRSSNLSVVENRMRKRMDKVRRMQIII